MRDGLHSAYGCWRMSGCSEPQDAWPNRILFRRKRISLPCRDVGRACPNRLATGHRRVSSPHKDPESIRPRAEEYIRTSNSACCHVPAGRALPRPWPSASDCSTTAAKTHW